MPADASAAAAGADGPRPDDAPRPASPKPPGLRDQAGATKDALTGLVRAHVDLAKAEAGDILDEVKVVAAAAGIAFGALLLLSFLLPIGLLLFLGEWLFGSLGWGVLHGTELLLFVAIAAPLAALGLARVGRSVLLALLAGVVVAALFGSNLPNTAWRAIGESFRPGIDPGPIAYGIGAVAGAVIGALLGVLLGARGGSAGGAGGGLIGGAIAGAVLGVIGGGVWRLAENDGSRPLAVGLLVIGAVFALLGLLLGARSGGLAGAIGGLVVGFVLGAILGAISAVTYPWHVAIAVGIAVALGLAPALVGADVASRGVDTDQLKARFWPQTTIDTAKETLEWAKQRIPRGPRS